MTADVLILTNGDQYEGDVTSIDASELTIRFKLKGDIPARMALGRDAVSWVGLGGRAATSPKGTRPEGDVVTLANDEILKGVVLGLNEKNLSFKLQLKGDVTAALTVERSQIASIRFGRLLPRPPDARHPASVSAPHESISEDAQRLRNGNWAAFGKGAFVVWEASSVHPDQIIRPSRHKIVFDGMNEGMSFVRQMGLEDGRWSTVGTAVPWNRTGRSLGELGAVPGTPRKQVIRVDDQQLSCTVTPYSLKAAGPEGTINAQIDVWRCDKIILPTQVINIVGQGLLAGSDVVRVTGSGEDRGLRREMDWVLEKAADPIAIGGKTIQAAMFHGSLKLDRIDGESTVTVKRWVSNEVPGGIVKTVENERTGSKTTTKTQVVVEIGSDE